ncbi:MAG: ArsR family transcriptional regulator [Gammaproteobacteria bacterium]|nr:ArsR family transcriptional regulator [Gammaproteobacteria bacterium]
MTSSQQAAIEPALYDSLVREDSPRATAFIVTVYGDVVEPRGGRLGMGALIETCAEHGINEGLVRTVVSRLVTADRLVGERVGRKSFYRLTRSAQKEFAAAAGLLYAPPPQALGWLMSIGKGRGEAAQAPDWVRVGADIAMAPNRADVARPPGMLLAAETLAGGEEQHVFAARHWPLDDVAAAYAAFNNAFRPLAEELSGGDAPEGALALALRLRLVDLYRQAALADPRLPRAAYPKVWPGEEARALFVKLYLSLAAAADAYVGLAFYDEDGPLPAETAMTRCRLDNLRRESQR